MAALTKDRNTRCTAWVGRAVPVKVKAATIIYKGAMVAVDATGYAIPASDTAALKVIGVAAEQADNSAGANGAIWVECHKGVHLFTNNGTNPVVQASIGSNAQVQDDQTVRISGSVNSIVAGVIDYIDTNGEIAIYFA